MSQNKRLIAIQGPTASGKTALAIAIANHFKTEILSADSRQFYREMTIGTAKPDCDELTEATHHFIDSDTIQHPVNVADYEKRAIELLEKLFQKQDTLVITGGSGMFIDAVIKGLDNVPTDEKLREQLIKRHKNEGLKQLVQELLSMDSEADKFVDLKNPVRVIRALEVIKISSQPMRHFQNRIQNRAFETYRFAIDLPRESLYERINLRVDKMMEKGLLEEAKELYTFRGLKSLETVGYSELFDYFEGKINLERAVELIKQNSRRYAKRQMTWLRRTADIHWLSSTTLDQQVEEIINALP